LISITDNQAKWTHNEAQKGARLLQPESQ